MLLNDAYGTIWEHVGTRGEIDEHVWNLLGKWEQCVTCLILVGKTYGNQLEQFRTFDNGQEVPRRLVSVSVLNVWLTRTTS